MDNAPAKPEAVPPGTAFWSVPALAARFMVPPRVACPSFGARHALIKAHDSLHWLGWSAVLDPD